MYEHTWMLQRYPPYDTVREDVVFSIGSIVAVNPSTR